MTEMELKPHQAEAVEKLSSGKILKGGVGTGKTFTALAFFVTKICESSLLPVDGVYLPMSEPVDLYVVTTARKRDDLDWQRDAAKLGIGSYPETSRGNVKLTVESWNNIGRLSEVRDAFFIFDEQRLVGSGAWVKAFLKIAANNRWILLSATPGDAWLDYVPVFIANGYYKNRSEFIREHVVYNQFTKFPKIDRYVGQGRLNKLRRELIVDMPYERHTTRHVRNVVCDYDPDLYQRATKDRWHPFEERPIKEAGEFVHVLRRIVSTHSSRLEKVRELMEKHPRLIIFYNFNYELEILRSLRDEIEVAEWNGQVHEPVPTGERWVYLVQYTAGSEAWNCTTTNAIAFYSLNYSYKIMEQCMGRIDRLNTPFKDLYYYFLRSSAGIDLAIMKAIRVKKKFNERGYAAASGW